MDDPFRPSGPPPWPTLIISVTLLGELADGHTNGARTKLAAQIDFLRNCLVELPRDHVDCVQAEVSDARAYVDGRQLERLYNEMLRSPRLAKAELKQRHEKNNWWYQYDTRTQEGLLRRLETQSAVRKETVRYLEDLETHIENWCRNKIRRNRSEWRLSRDESAWPTPQAIRTLWALEGYRLTRMAVACRDARKLDVNDHADHEHYVYAAHADVLVSEDRNLRRNAEACPTPRPRILSLSQWVDEVVPEIDRQRAG